MAGIDTEVKSFALSQDGALIVVGDDTGELKLFTYGECRLIHIENVHAGPISAVKISHDNLVIMSADIYG